MKLGERLSALAAMVPAGSRVADIGTDHAYLPIYLAENNLIQHAIAVDVNHGPYASACEAVHNSGMSGRIFVRLADGLKGVSPGEVDVAILAGMGGITMIEIMEASPEVVASLKLIILQPMVATAQVRRWLKEHCWKIVDETIVEDEGRLYEVIAAKPGLMNYDLLEIGPILWENRHPLLGRLLTQRLDTLYHIVNQMEKSVASVNNPKYLEQKALISELEAKLACLQSAEQ